MVKKGLTSDRKALVLLIGTNPLANYIIPLYFKTFHNYRNFVFIFSEDNQVQKGTQIYAERVKNLLHLHPDQVFLVPLKDIGNVQQILEDLDTVGIWEQFDEVHLNYKPGTKPMVVGVYNFLKNFYQTRFSASYLDTRRFKIVYDSGDIFPVLGDLRNYLFLDIKTLLKLSLYEKLKADSWEDFKFKETLQTIKKVVIEENRIEEFLSWLENPFRRIFKNDKDLFKTAKRFKEHLKKPEIRSFIETLETSTPDFVWEILESLPEDKKLTEGRSLWVPPENLGKEALKQRVKDSIEFLDGLWLEWYVYGELKEKLEDLGLKEKMQFGLSLKAQKDSKPFELDLFIINGYQLIGISITTEDRSNICKLKGFEIIHRVKQIGGEEGRAFLITGLPQEKVKETQKDLSFVDGSLESKIVIYGREDWKEIGLKLIDEVF
ncbi:MAG: Uncharacterized protein XD67_0890 [Thermodesulfobacterium commune]|uniref:DUF1887 domain-containing protein n=1 Tax=Thermodesulfobacterium commune TaxID=1741 RepID=A0A117LC77_9BACT|nr:MAG: Uncharacterized protein XD67_0890 [Thermodesulfobacterium commune]HAA83372.1 DUF1887 domain-containing protein [Thermodesulfobacterium commune]